MPYKKEPIDEKPNLEELKRQSVKYNPEYFVEDLQSLLTSFKAKIELLEELEFTTKQKCILMGTIMGIFNSINQLIEKMKEWGYLPK